jgi:hypothetical protein
MIRIIKIIGIVFWLLSNVLYAQVRDTITMAQKISDTSFVNVILLEKEQVVQQDEDYLLDIVYDFDVKKSSVIVNDTPLSKSFFFDRLFKEKPFILITPHKAYYKSIEAEATRENLHIEPAPTNIFYQRYYEKSTLKTDSIIVSGDHPTFNFLPQVEDLKTNQIIVAYYTVSFGSTCCQKDQKWEIEERLYQCITNFETKNNLDIGDIYIKTTGKEGEKDMFFTLSGLTLAQKLSFLKEIRYWTLSNKKRKNIKYKPQIFTPFTVQKKGLKITLKSSVND